MNSDLSRKTEEYLTGMLTARAEGGRIEDYIGSEGVEALRKITFSAEGNSPSVMNIVPTVTEIDEKGVSRGYDLFSLLMKHRIVLLQGPVDENMAAIACASLLYLNADASGDPTAPIKVYINSPGGSVTAGDAIYDTMRSIAAPVETVGFGMQASMGSILLAAGDTRKMTRSSKLMIHSIGSGTQGKQGEQEIGLNSAERLFEEMKAVYIRHIGLTGEFWDLMCAHDTWLSAEQAYKIGFIDEIIVGDRKPAPYESAAKAFMKANQDSRDNEVPATKEEILKLLTVTGANQGRGARYRPELLVALAQMPEYWTEELKAAKAAKAVAAAEISVKAPANQNTASTPKARLSSVAPN